MLRLDQVLVYGPPGGVFHPADYPEADTLIVTAAGGASSDGNPGTAETRLFRTDELPPTLRIVCGEGGRGADGHRGESGYVIIELYQTEP